MTCDYCLGAGRVWVAAFAGYDICPDCCGTGKPTPPPKVRALSPAERGSTQDHDGGCICDDCRAAIQSAAKESGF